MLNTWAVWTPSLGGLNVTRLRASILLFGLLVLTAPSFGGFYEDFYRGMRLAATPSGSPVSAVGGGGMANGARFGRLRIVPNEFGDGHRLEFDRTFGTDSRGRQEVFDIGPLELTLSGATSSTVQYTRNLAPTLNIDAFTNNFAYLLSNKTGVQDFELRGNLNVSHQLEINKFGFYYLDLEINHTNASMVADGIIVDGPEDTDFDVGPISIRGNVFVDLAAAVLGPTGFDTSGLEGIFPESPIARINDELNSYIDQQRQVLGEVFAADLADGALDTGSALAARDFAGGLTGPLDAEPAVPGTFGNIPESATLLLIGALTIMAGLRRRL